MLRTGEDEAAAEGTVLRTDEDEADFRVDDDDAFFFGFVITLATYHSDKQYCHQSYISFYKFREVEVKVSISYLDTVLPSFLWFCDYTSNLPMTHNIVINHILSTLFYKFREVEVKVSISYLDTVLPSFLWFCYVTSNLPDTQHCHKSYILLYKYREVEVKVKNIK